MLLFSVVNFVFKSMEKDVYTIDRQSLDLIKTGIRRENHILDSFHWTNEIEKCEKIFEVNKWNNNILSQEEMISFPGTFCGINATFPPQEQNMQILGFNVNLRKDIGCNLFPFESNFFSFISGKFSYGMTCDLDILNSAEYSTVFKNKEIYYMLHPYENKINECRSYFPREYMEMFLNSVLDRILYKRKYIVILQCLANEIFKEGSLLLSLDNSLVLYNDVFLINETTKIDGDFIFKYIKEKHGRDFNSIIENAKDFSLGCDFLDFFSYIKKSKPSFSLYKDRLKEVKTEAVILVKKFLLLIIEKKTNSRK